MVCRFVLYKVLCLKMKEITLDIPIIVAIATPKMVRSPEYLIDSLFF